MMEIRVKEGQLFGSECPFFMEKIPKNSCNYIYIKGFYNDVCNKENCKKEGLLKHKEFKIILED